MEKELIEANEEYASLFDALRPLATASGTEARQVLAELTVEPDEPVDARTLLTAAGDNEAVVEKLTREIEEVLQDGLKALEGAKQVGRLFGCVPLATEEVEASQPVRVLTPAAARCLFVALKDTQRFAVKTAALTTAYLRTGVDQARALVKPAELALHRFETAALDKEAHQSVLGWLRSLQGQSDAASLPSTALSAAALSQRLWLRAIILLSALRAVASLLTELY